MKEIAAEKNVTIVDQSHEGAGKLFVIHSLQLKPALGVYLLFHGILMEYKPCWSYVIS
jgi:hypothetical protein